MKNEKILVIQTAFLGDAILTLPMIQKLKELFPVSEIDVVSIPSTREVFEHSPFVNRVYSYDKRGSQKSFLNLIKFAKHLKADNYNRIYSPHRSFRTSLIVMILNAGLSFGFDNSSFAYVYKKLIKYDRNAHEVERNLQLIGFDTQQSGWRIPPLINIPGAVKEKIKNTLNKNASPLIAIAPGSVWNTKKYPEEYYLQLSRMLAEKNYFILYMGSKSDFGLCERLHRNIADNSINLAGNFTVVESVEALKYCGLLISNDSAPTHMGMIAGIPVLTLYCSTIPGFGFYPYNSRSSFLSIDGLDCKPCGIHGRKACPIKSFECGYRLKPESVLEESLRLLTVKEK